MSCLPMEFDSDSGRYDTVEFDSGMIVVFNKYIFGATIKVTKCVRFSVYKAKQ